MASVRVMIVVGAVVMVVVGLAGAGAALRAEPTAVAVVNVERVFDALDERAAIEAEVRSREQEFHAEREQRHREIRQLEQDLDLLAPGEEAFVQKERELVDKAIDFRTWNEIQTQRFQMEQARQMERLYRRILEGVRATAEEEGYDLVLYQEGPLHVQGGGDPNEVLQQIALRKVLYANAETDISDRVIQRLNNEFEARQ